MLDPDSLASGDETQKLSLEEASQAVMDVLEETHAELSALRRRLGDEDLDPHLDLDKAEFPSPREQALHVAARLEACAGALRDASAPERE